MAIEVINKGIGNRIEIADDVFANNTQVMLLGNNNRLSIKAGVKLGNSLLEIRNHDSEIHIGSNCVINGHYRCRANGTTINIGPSTTIMNAQITLHEAGTIKIGTDCMFSGNIHMDVSDMHSILDAKTGQRINPPEDIEIGDHVWLAQGVSIQKGVRIGANAIIGARAVVTSEIPAQSLAVGVPARVIKEGVTWDRRRLPW